MVNAKLTIKNEMSAIDTKNRTWYNTFTDDEKKKGWHMGANALL